MELRQYLAVVRRRWPLVAIIVVLTALVSAGMYVSQHATFTAVTRLALRQIPQPAQTPAPGQPGLYTYDNYYNWTSSEYLADDYTQIIPSQAFAERISAQLKQQTPSLNIAADAIHGALGADRSHRELTISASSPDSGQAIAIANGAAAVLTGMSNAAATTPNLNNVAIHDDALFALLDPATGTVSNRSRQLTNAVIAVGVGFVIALALAFLVEYLDPALRDRTDAEQVVGLPVLATIPVRR